MNNNSPSFVRNQSDDFENIVCTNIGDELVVSKLITMNSSLLEDVEQLMYKMKSYKKCLAELASKLNEIKACRQLKCTNDVDDKSTSGSTMTDLEVALTGLDGLTMDDVTYNSTEENRDQDDTRAAKIDEFPMLDVSKASLAEPSTGRLHDIVELPNIFQNNNAKIANKLRLSNNPSVRKLKALKSIDEIPVSSRIELMLQIVEEEGLNMRLQFSTPHEPPIRKHFMIGEPETDGLRTFGYGRTMSDSQTTAILQILANFKFILNN